MKIVIKKPDNVKCALFKCTNCHAEYYEPVDDHTDYLDSVCPYCDERITSSWLTVKTISAEEIADIAVEIIK